VENFIVRDNQIVGCYDNMEVRILLSEVPLIEVLSNCFSLTRLTPVGQNSQMGAELFYFLLPIMQCRRRRNYKKRTPVAFIFWNVRKQCDCLNCLSQSHLIS